MRFLGPSGRWIYLRRGLMGLLVGLLGIGIYLGYLQLSGNFHTVVPGELYRSAQPSEALLDFYAKKYGIRTVVNLRGENPDSPWYREEVAATRRLGLDHVDFRMSAAQGMSQAEATQLLTLLDSARKPILIHCMSGADRSGLAAALYVAAIAKAGERSAESQLSLWFGHLAIPVLSAAWPMDEAWEALEPWLGFEDS